MYGQLQLVSCHGADHTVDPEASMLVGVPFVLRAHLATSGASVFAIPWGITASDQRHQWGSMCTGPKSIAMRYVVLTNRSGAPIALDTCIPALWERSATSMQRFMFASLRDPMDKVLSICRIQPATVARRQRHEVLAAQSVHLPSARHGEH